MSSNDEAQMEEIRTIISGLQSDLKEAQAEFGTKALPEWEEKAMKAEEGPWNQRGWPVDDTRKPPSGGLVITEREYLMIGDCHGYVAGNKSGLPGHNLMILVAKLSEHLENLYGISPNDGPYVINQ